MLLGRRRRRRRRHPVRVQQHPAGRGRRRVERGSGREVRRDAVAAVVLDTLSSVVESNPNPFILMFIQIFL